MSPPTSFRAVYKQLGEQEIDVDVYLPSVETDSTKCPVRKLKHLAVYVSMLIAFK